MNQSPKVLSYNRLGILTGILVVLFPLYALWTARHFSEIDHNLHDVQAMAQANINGINFLQQAFDKETAQWYSLTFHSAGAIASQEKKAAPASKMVWDQIYALSSPVSRPVMQEYSDAIIATRKHLEKEQEQLQVLIRKRQLDAATQYWQTQIKPAQFYYRTALMKFSVFNRQLISTSKAENKSILSDMKWNYWAFSIAGFVVIILIGIVFLPAVKWERYFPKEVISNFWHQWWSVNRHTAHKSRA